MTHATPGDVVVGLDVGTTGVKAVAFSPGSPWHASALREYPLLHPAPDHEVQDLAVVLQAAGEALARCVASANGAKVLAVAVSSAMHGLAALDSSCRPITPLLTWADGRARCEALDLLRSVDATGLQASTGAPVHPMAPLAKLLWFARHDPGTSERARWWVGLKDVLLLWLTGRLVTELSSASGTGLLDVATRSWSERALALCGVDPSKLPQILPTTDQLELSPTVAASVGLPAGTPVVVGAADGPLANLGTGAIAPGIAGLSLGTSGAIRLAVDGPHPDRRGELFSYALADPLWVVGGATSNGADVLRWARGVLAPSDASGIPGSTLEADAAALELAAGVSPGSDGLVMLPHLLAERAPLWSPSLAGAYLGLRRDHTRAHLLRAALEGVCLQMRLLLDRLDAAYDVSSIRATGGAFRSPLWTSLMAAALDRPLVVAIDADGTARGAAVLGLYALGLVSSLEDGCSALGAAAGEPTDAVARPPELVESFARLRESVPVLVDALASAAAHSPRAG